LNKLPTLSDPKVGWGILARIGLALALQVGLLATISATAYISSLFFALGMFYASELAFFPLFKMDDVFNIVTMSLPFFLGSLVFIMILHTTFSFILNKINSKPERDRRKAAIIALVVIAIAVVGQAVWLYVLYRSITIVTMTGLLVWLSWWASSRISLAKKSTSSLIAGLIAGYAGYVLLFLSIMFTVGYMWISSVYSQYPDATASAVVDGRRIKVIVIFPSQSRTLYYDGAEVRVAGAGFLDSVRTARPR